MFGFRSWVIFFLWPSFCKLQTKTFREACFFLFLSPGFQKVVALNGNHAETPLWKTTVGVKVFWKGKLLFLLRSIRGQMVSQKWDYGLQYTIEKGKQSLFESERDLFHCLGQKEKKYFECFKSAFVSVVRFALKPLVWLLKANRNSKPWS